MGQGVVNLALSVSRQAEKNSTVEVYPRERSQGHGTVENERAT